MNGLPGAGKTTLGAALSRHLNAWFLSKDAIKEALADCLENASEIPELGGIAMDTVWALAKESPTDVIIDSWWFKPRDLTFARAGIKKSGAGRVIEVWCDVPPELARTRYASRQRPALHRDQQHLAENWNNWSTHATPLGLAPTLRVDTTRTVDLTDLVRRIRTLGNRRAGQDRPVMTENGSAEYSWADPNTLLGLMERGRGACFAGVGREPELAGELVVGCIVRDPRWDRQVEQRGWLYAMLVAESGVELSRLRAAYDGAADPHGDSDAWLVTGVLGLLARRGVEGAVGELRYYLRLGRDLGLALNALGPFVDRPDAEGVLGEVLEVADDEELRSALAFGDLAAAPWPEWRRISPRIERVAVAVEEDQLRWERPPCDRSARESIDRERVMQAGVEFGLITSAGVENGWEATILNLGPELLRQEGCPFQVRLAASRSLRRLRSPQALAWARASATLDDVAGQTALSMFAGRAVSSDGPRLLELLVESAARGNDHIYHQCDLVSALGRLNHVAAISTVAAIFDTTVYSYLREKCASTLAGIAPGFANERAIECLDDCEPGTRAIGIRLADLSIPGVRERIGRAAEDPTEKDENRTAAAARITE
ncbi:AAA family ATPase [Nocardia sp. NPDC020380]|uniref:AAA family ATPase n=1 Tax=Nocardia sp. NPDC020380 TaxID=3364309 RepID=UPI00378C49CD